jgi:hypothetical protein
MATFHAKGKLNLTLLVGNEKFVQVAKKCLCAMLLLGSVHVPRMLCTKTIMLSLVPSTKSHHLAFEVYRGWLAMASIK